MVLLEVKVFADQNFSILTQCSNTFVLNKYSEYFSDVTFLFLFQVCNIGTFTDSDIPLLFCVRHLASSFLLTGSPGHVMPDKNVRVSVKALALSCISCVVRHLPGCILLPLDKSSQRQFDIMSSKYVLYSVS